MAPKKEFYKKLLSSPGKVYYAKLYDYLPLEKGDKIIIYKRLYEGKKWIKLYSMNKGSFEEAWESRIKHCKINKKWCERFVI